MPETDSKTAGRPGRPRGEKIAVAVVALVSLVGLVAWYLMPDPRIARFEAEGVVASAQVMDKRRIVRQHDDDISIRYTMRVGFRIGDEFHYSSADVTRRFFDQYEKSDRIPIVYLPGEPIQVIVDPDYHGDKRFDRLLIGLFLIVIFIAGYYFNASEKRAGASPFGNLRRPGHRLREAAPPVLLFALCATVVVWMLMSGGDDVSISAADSQDPAPNAADGRNAIEAIRPQRPGDRATTALILHRFEEAEKQGDNVVVRYFLKIDYRVGGDSHRINVEVSRDFFQAHEVRDKIPITFDRDEPTDVIADPAFSAVE